jgi:tight adherence protein B
MNETLALERLDAWILAALFVSGICGALLLGALLQAGLRVYREGLSPELTKGLRESAHGFSADRILLLCFVGALALGAIAALITDSLILALLLAGLAASVPTLSVRWMRRSRRLQFRNQLPDLMLLMAGALRSGAGLSLALGRVAASMPMPAHREIERVLQAMRMGTSLGQALTQLERRMPIEEVTLWVTALRIGAESGSGMAPVLESLSDTLRRKLVLERKIRALTAQGRLQAWVMSALPLMVLLLLSVVDPESFGHLVATEEGRILLLGVFLGQVLGFLQIRRIVSIEV